jgi:hypothetical protein
MSLLFLALAFFYGLLSLMMRLTQDRPRNAVAVAVEEEGEGPEEAVAMLRAAAIAVALARSGAESSQRSSGTSTPEIAVAPQVTPWWTLYHQRLLRGNAPMRRSR